MQHPERRLITGIYVVLPVIPNDTDLVTEAIAEIITTGSSWATASPPLKTASEFPW
jgi:hypothetical protein